MNAGTDMSLFRCCAALLGLIAIGVVWLVPFPPMQDYPQHLFITYVNATYNDPAFDWPVHYQAGLRAGPYSLFYLLTAGATRMVGPLAAGKAFLTLYICLVGLAARPARRDADTPPPWGGLALFPLAFHQMYFMGFTNFLISIPLLLFALNDLPRLRRSPGAAAALRHALLTGLVFLSHPYTLLVYICLAGADALFPRRHLPALAPPLIALGVFAAWYAATMGGRGQGLPLQWWPWGDNAMYFLLPFNGFNLADGPRWPIILSWSVILAAAVHARLACGRRRLVPTRLAVFFLLTLAGFFVLPFWAGRYSYFNLRLAPIAYFLAALLLASLPMRRGAGLAVAMACGALLVQSATLQKTISDETAALVPLIEKMRPNALLLPISFKTGSAALDPKFFPEAHAHDFFYYHIIRGGGANPFLFPNPMLPIAFKPGVRLPRATHGFSWNEQGRFYDYILTRQAPAGFLPFIQRFARLTGTSGQWALFSNPAPAMP